MVMISFRPVIFVHSPFVFHLVAHLEATGTVPCRANKVRSQPLPPLFFWHVGLLLGPHHHLFTSVSAECLTWMDKQFGLFRLFTDVAVSCAFLFCSQSCYRITIRERVCQVLYVLPLYFELYMFTRAQMD